MTVVFKLGGSLLSLPGLADTIRSVVDLRRGENCLFVVGGGAAADVVREWSEIHQFDDETSHWLAIASLDLNRQLLESLTGWRVASSIHEANRHWEVENRPLLLDVGKFMRDEEKVSFPPLPHHWDVTSDSIAAWVGLCWSSDELVLLKSVPAPIDIALEVASEQAFVDPYFPRLARRVNRIGWCDLRASTIVISEWLTNSNAAS